MARRDWLIFHGGALGDLVLTIQLALRLPGIGESRALRVVSRTNPGDLSTCRPSIGRLSPEGLKLHWLYGDHDRPLPERLRDVVRDTRVLSALGGVHTIVHRGLQELGPAALYSIDPRPRDGVERHITQQWQTQLEAQGLLVPKCVHQRPTQRGVGVPDDLRQRGRELLHRCLSGRHTSPSPERERGAIDDVVLIHPGSGGRGRCWPLRCFVEVGRQVRGSGRAAICFVVGPVESERWAEVELAALSKEFPMLRCPEPDELVATLAAARAFVGNDAGPGHLAALLGTPTVTVFGPTSPSVWRPLGTNAQVVAGEAEAYPETWGIEPKQVASIVPAYS